MKLLQLNFLPRSADLALLLLRVWYGASILAVPGWMKLTNFSAMAGQFKGPFGLSGALALGLVLFAEIGCAALLVLGLWTRLAALILAFTMSVAFWWAHGAKLAGDNNGMPAFLYLGAFVALFFAGAGKFSLDAKMGAKA
jgi:putative oxidoreductase